MYRFLHQKVTKGVKTKVKPKNQKMTDIIISKNSKVVFWKDVVDLIHRPDRCHITIMTLNNLIIDIQY